MLENSLPADLKGIRRQEKYLLQRKEKKPLSGYRQLRRMYFERLLQAQPVPKYLAQYWFVES